MTQTLAAADIRDYAERDAEPLKALWRAAGLGNDPNDPDQDLFNIRSTGAGRIFVIEREKRLVAAAVAGRDGRRGWIYYVAVAPDCRGEGLGRRIVEHAEAWLRAAGAPKVLLLIRDTNSGVETFYEKLGYVREPCFVMGRWLADDPAGPERPEAAPAPVNRRGTK